ncbi:MAG: hypothetical protein ACRYGR_09525 [Janthinobacterium lividum]
MKKIYFVTKIYTAFFALCFSSLHATNPDVDNITTSNLSIHFWNEDIGPVKGGNFLRDQEFFKENVYGKYPGSGLFLIPNGLNAESDAHPLFFLVPVVRVITKQGEIIETPSSEKKLEYFKAGNKKYCLGLPGESTDITYPVEHKDVLSLSVRLDSYKFSFTTSGGSIFITYKGSFKLSPFITSESNEFEKPINVTFSWPRFTYHVKDNYDSQMLLNAQFNEPLKKVTKQELVPNWKTSMGIYTGGEQQDKICEKICYPTRSFNRQYEGNDKPEDFFTLGDDFSYYAGHSLTDNPFSS